DGRPAGSVPAAGPRMAYAPPAPTTRDLLRDEKADAPRALPSERREAAASRADQEKELSGARPGQELALKAPDATRRSGGSNALSTPVTAPAPGRMARPQPTGELPGGPMSIAGRTAGQRAGSVRQTRDPLFASGDRSAQRENVALNSSPTLSPPALHPPSHER